MEGKTLPEQKAHIIITRKTVDWLAREHLHLKLK